jgi:hypothetical protein
MANRSSPLATAFYFAVLAASAFGLTAVADNKWFAGHSDPVNDAVVAAGTSEITAYRVRQRSPE